MAAKAAISLMSKVITETPRLVLRLATPADAAFICTLWNDPRVMGFVGFPNGLGETEEKIRASIEKRGVSEFHQLLLIMLKDGNQAIGQCKMELPNPDGICETDVKLRPEFWGQRYGLEVKRALLDYLFTHTDCRVVQATLNVANKASIRMQEAVGGIRVGKGLSEFPESMRSYTTPVHYYVYQVTRDYWLEEQNKGCANVE